LSAVNCHIMPLATARRPRWPAVGDHGRARFLGAGLLVLALCCLPLPAAGIDEELLTEDDRALLVEAVEAAFELDLYNARCRNDQSGRRTENLNKELVSRFRMTVLDVMDDLFPEAYYRSARERMREDFLARLRTMGGCAGAKAEGLRNSLGARYDAAMEAVAARP
jgi:hypothetical protein